MKRQSYSALDQIIAPVSRDVFFSEYFEARTLHRSLGHFPFSISEGDASKLLESAITLDSRNVRANQGGVVLRPPNDIDSEIFAWAIKVYQSGATIIINKIETLDLRILQFSKDIASDFQGRAHITLFWTPALAQGFAPHFDTLDVFVLQLFGEKNWSIGPSPVYLPTRRQGYLVDLGIAPIPKENFSLRRGDSFYIPRGVVHWAQTSETSSIHLSVEIETVSRGAVLSNELKCNEVTRRLSSGWPAAGDIFLKNS